MFADDVEAVLRSLRACLTPGGALAAAVWGPIDRNPIAALRDDAARPFLSGPPPDPERTPNPMRLARRGLLATCLRRAGFQGVRADAAAVAAVYSNVDELVQIQLESALAEVHASLDAPERRRLAVRLARRFRRFEDGPVVRVPAHAWVVSGKR